MSIYNNKCYQKVLVRRLAVTRRLAVNTQFSSNYPVASFNFIGIVVYFIFCFTVIGLIILVSIDSTQNIIVFLLFLRCDCYDFLKRNPLCAKN